MAVPTQGSSQRDPVDSGFRGDLSNFPIGMISANFQRSFDGGGFSGGHNL